MLIKKDQSDVLYFQEYLDVSPELLKVIEEGEQHYFAFRSLAEDVFCMFFKLNPQKIVSAQNASPVAEAALDQIKLLPEYEKLRLTTKLDALASGLATRHMCKSLLAFLPSCPDNPQTLKEREAALIAQLDSDFVNDETRNRVIKEIQELREKIKQAIQNLSGANRADKVSGGQMRKHLQDALAAAEPEIVETAGAAESFGFDSQVGVRQQVNLTEKIAMANIVKRSAKLKQIAEIAGRFKQIAKKKRKSNNSVSDVSDIAYGSSLERALPSELMLLSNVATESLFYHKLAEGKLLGYTFSGRDNVGKGPIIICIDGSGSMSGTPEYASKGIALALMEIARKERRDFAMIQFSDQDSIRSFAVKRGELNRLELLSELEFFFGGGTDFQSPLRQAMHLIDDSRFKRADVIFITDGECHIGEQFLLSFNQLKENKEFSCYGILVGCNSQVVSKFCDEVFMVDDLVGESQANDQMHEKIFNLASSHL